MTEASFYNCWLCCVIVFVAAVRLVVVVKEYWGCRQLVGLAE